MFSHDQIQVMCLGQEYHGLMPHPPHGIPQVVQGLDLSPCDVHFGLWAGVVSASLLHCKICLFPIGIDKQDFGIL